MTHPWQWSATTALAQTRSNKVSCREIAVATLERIAAVNPSVNALTRVLGDEALFAADRADAAQQRGEPGGPDARRDSDHEDQHRPGRCADG